MNPTPKLKVIYANQASTYNYEDMIKKYNSKFIDDFSYDYAMLFDGKITNVTDMVSIN